MSKECYTRYEVERQLWERWPRVLVVTEHSPQGTAQRRYVPEDSVEVVRCRDCEHARHYRPYSWKGKRSTIEEWYCEWHSNPEGASEIEPDGFCAWGERRDG